MISRWPANNNRESEKHEITPQGTEMSEETLFPTDDRFSVKVSDNMEIRNALRAGLVEAQGKNADKIPLFVSWPEWLEDGIVCLYARDLRQLLREVVRETAETLGDASGKPE